MRAVFLIVLGCAPGVLLTGCRCWPGIERYHDAIDCVQDHTVQWDGLYTPRLDVSRAGKPDWCGPLNRKAGPCRCQQGTYNGYDACHHYPPSYPTAYPSQAVPPQGMILMPTEVLQPMPPASDVPPAPVPGTPVPGTSVPGGSAKPAIEPYESAPAAKPARVPPGQGEPMPPPPPPPPDDAERALRGPSGL